MHRSRSGLLGPVLENTLTKYKKGWSRFEGKADLPVLAPKWHLACEGRSEFYELSYCIQFVAKCFNMIVDSSFINSVIGYPSLVAKCSNILQDNLIAQKNSSCMHALYFQPTIS